MRAWEERQALLAARRNSTSTWWNTQEQLTATVLQSPGEPWRPRIARGVFAPPVSKLSGALVQAAPNAVLSPNYIESLLSARDLNVLRTDTVLQPAPQALLYLLLRHSMLLEYAAGASRLLINRQSLVPAQRREPELVNIQAGQPTRTVWDQLNETITVAGVSAPKKLSEYLLGFLPSGEPDTAREPDLKPLSDFRASLAHLKSLDANRLEELMTGTLDLCSHRLDAWITSFATKRLAEMRKTSSTGVLFGGYGWVMNLKPAVAQTTVTSLPPGEQGPIFQLANNPGFVHTPSLTQAATAAILRSGHLAHSGVRCRTICCPLICHRSV